LRLVTINLGNEAHIDVGDGADGIAIWHEETPGNEDTPGNIGNWFFLFPDMKIEIEGKWHAGVAIPLCHGVVVTRDGSIIRHATAMPTIKTNKSVAWGTFFATSRGVVSVVSDLKEKRKMLKNKRKRL
jgi:hypothetical protein